MVTIAHCDVRIAYRHALEPQGVNHLAGKLVVERRQAMPPTDIVEFTPIVGVDEVDVVARTPDPAESNLPPELMAHCVVLQSIGQEHPRTELRAGVGPIHVRRETSLGQIEEAALGFERERDATPRSQLEPRGDV